MTQPQPKSAHHTTGSRGFWCEFSDTGKPIDLIDAPRDESPGFEYVWMQEVAADELQIYKDAMDSMAAQFVYPKTTGLEMAKSQLGIKQ